MPNEPVTDTRYVIQRLSDGKYYHHFTGDCWVDDIRGAELLRTGGADKSERAIAVRVTIEVLGEQDTDNSTKEPQAPSGNRPSRF